MIFGGSLWCGVKGGGLSSCDIAAVMAIPYGRHADLAKKVRKTERFEHGGNVYAHPGCVDFSANLNPLGMPQSARRALRNGVDAFCRYPDPACGLLTDALASFERVPPGWVLACAGATDAFWRVCAVLRPRRATVCAPCYSGYEQALEQVGASVSYERLREEDSFSLTGLAGEYDVAFVANPNNPTGRCVDRDVLVACLDAAKAHDAYVVLDECFIDLTGRDGSNDLLGRYSNLVLVKAFTKTFALAGLRLGYVLCSDVGLLDRLRAAGQPWAVSVPAQLAGVACAGEKTYLRKSRKLVARERGRLCAALGRYGLHTVDGEANYLLFRGPVGLHGLLLSHGILVRSCQNYVGLDHCWYRIAVRTPWENNRFIDALHQSVCDPSFEAPPTELEKHAAKDSETGVGGSTFAGEAVQ